MDDIKIKRTFYLTPEANTALNEYISINYVTSYGATSQTVSNAINFYTQSPESLTPHAFQKSRMWKTLITGKPIPKPSEEVKNEECATE